MNFIKVICSWCGKDMGTKQVEYIAEPKYDTTHSICEECLKKEVASLKVPTRQARKVKEIIDSGHTIISIHATSTECATDAHNASYGGPEISIVVEKKILRNQRRVLGILGGPLNPGEIPY